jgi:hypothetical protein
MKIKPEHQKYGIRCNSGYGPIFGSSDIQIASYSNTNTSSCSYLGYSFKHPQYFAFETNEAKSFLAGSYQFRLSEIEVYQKV